eukprot:gnl/MRDRNA2_/MRDRNA2_90117_c0_seq1.p1 gnl/MRDRNA2_/MRDRNA2_90117_c0~~gnl/MRDRNA2_/MRDRNA2_90117_c0_seq1.p1  ORF type:complete len:260 (+),score=64.05 gnl/MRDRNA2_/MRDRNA2_90117_c0_seq1:92-871(+)
MMVGGAQQDMDYEDRAEAVRRALGGLVGNRKGAGMVNISSPKLQAKVPATTNQPMQTPVPRIPLQSTSNLPSREQSKDVMNNMPKIGSLYQAPAVKDESSNEVKQMELYTSVSQPGVGESDRNGGATSKDAQELLCQLRLTEKQPIRGLATENAFPEPAPVAQPAQRPGRILRNRDSVVGRTGKKKTEIEKENDKLLDELEALGESVLEVAGETPVDMNQRLRKEATAAMLKHSFFIKKRPTPPASTASGYSGDFTNRS